MYIQNGNECLIYETIIRFSTMNVLLSSTVKSPKIVKVYEGSIISERTKLEDCGGLCVRSLHVDYFDNHLKTLRRSGGRGPVWGKNETIGYRFSTKV